MKKIFILILCTVVLFSCKDEDYPVPTALYVDETEIAVPANGETKTMEVKTTASNVTLETDDSDWYTATLSGSTLTIVIDKNNSLAMRMASISLVAPDRSLDITLEQDGQPTVRLEVESGWASSYQPDTAGEGDIKYSFDGDMSTIYHSKWGETADEYELIYYLKDSPELALVSYYPRSNMGNGTFGDITIYASTTAAPDDFRKIMDYTCTQTAPYTGTHIELTEFVQNTHAVKIIVDGSTSKGGFAACAEMEFYGVEYQLR